MPLKLRFKCLSFRLETVAQYIVKTLVYEKLLLYCLIVSGYMNFEEAKAITIVCTNVKQ